MEAETKEQAREILRTVQLLQRWLTRVYESKRKSPDCCGLGELTLPQLNTLNAVRRREGATLKELAETLNVSAPSASSMVDRLVDMGMLSREQSSADRRALRVGMSDKGRVSIDSHEETMLSVIGALMERLGPEPTSQWLSVYAQIRAVLDADLESEITGDAPGEDS